MADFQALPAVRLTVNAAAELEPVQVQLPGAYIVMPSSSSPANPVLVHRQSTPSASWVIPNLPGARAIVLAVYDEQNRVGIADMTVTDTNTVISFSTPRTGRIAFIRG